METKPDTVPELPTFSSILSLSISESFLLLQSNHKKSNIIRWTFWCKTLGLLSPDQTESSWNDSLSVLKQTYITQSKKHLSELSELEQNDEDNPLSREYKVLFEIDVRNTIRMDLHRTALKKQGIALPEAPLFNALYTWAIQHRDIGYRQGMNEIIAFLGFCFIKASNDSKTFEAEPPALEKDNLEFLLFHSFSKLLELRLKDLYRFDEKCVKKLSLPINRKIWVIYKKVLRVADHQLFQHLEILKFEPMVFLIRWLRLLYLREYPFEDSMKLWDYIFSHFDFKKQTKLNQETIEVDIVDIISAAMLIHMKQAILEVDNDFKLIELLQNFPETPFEDISPIADSIISNLIRSNQQYRSLYGSTYSKAYYETFNHP